MTDYIPYYYLIGWTKLRKLYVGVRFCNSSGKVAHPGNFWEDYFTSSRYVKDFRKEHGEPDIRFTYPCATAQEAIDHELRVMREFQILQNFDVWLNRSMGRVRVDTPEMRQKKGAAFRGKKRGPQSPEHTAKLVQARIKNGTNSHPMSEETKAKIKESHRIRKQNGIKRNRKPMSEETKRKIGEANKGKLSGVTRDPKSIAKGVNSKRAKRQDK